MFLHTARYFFAIALLVVAASSVLAVTASLADYRQRISQAENEIARLRRSYSEPDRWPEQDIAAAIAHVREDLPGKEIVSANDIRVDVDNTWLHEALRDYEAANHSDQQSADALNRINERLLALEDRLKEIDTGNSLNATSKDDNKARLAEILRRPEYNQKVEETSALERLWIEFLRWLLRVLNRIFPRMQPIQPGSAMAISRIAQVLVVAIALAIIAYVAWKLLPRFLSGRSKKKTVKQEARIVLGERLEPDQTAADLFAQAEALARSGDLRAAIRKAYIALLCELGDRKLISLAQHKTNRDYLNAVRETRLYQTMRPLTTSFENHWYGFVPAGENDWNEFRSGYQKSVSSKL
jgi:Domain of unknown function (DUF4129)